MRTELEIKRKLEYFKCLKKTKFISLNAEISIPLLEWVLNRKLIEVGKE